MTSNVKRKAGFSRRLTEAFEEAQARGLGAVSFEDKMIDVMSYNQAQELVDFVEIIAEKEKGRQLTPSVSLSRFFTSGSTESR